MELRCPSLSCPDRSFYLRPTQDVAKELIGKKLVRNLKDGSMNRPERLSGIIIETEAYGAADDRASHAYRGITVRNRPMFGEVGMAYIYFIYGNHFCLNVSAHSNNQTAGAVLIRALEPCEGVCTMKRRRNSQSIHNLTSGPGRICQAMNISKFQNYLDMTDAQSEIHIEFGKECCDSDIVVTERVRIKYATEKKWRFIFDPVSNYSESSTF
jgi:DNA-3-methyladenine glycosylase